MTDPLFHDLYMNGPFSFVSLGLIGQEPRLVYTV